VIPCNFVQIMENSVDPHHVEWLHGYYFDHVGKQEGFVAPKSFQRKHLKTAFEDMEFGILKRRLYVDQAETDDDWAVGHPLMFPYGMRVGGMEIEQMQIRVPIDDTHTWVCFYSTHHPGADHPVDDVNTVTEYELPWKNPDGRIRVDYVEGQDIMAWVTQGEIADRTIEKIGKSDIGCVRVRRLFREQLARVEQGLAPMGVFYDDDRGRIDLPCEKDKFGAGGDFAFQWLNMGSHRFSPQLDRLVEIHRHAQRKVG
jgi:5,5'-dehydrodivanillate O-demethylase oxygenase subunit